MISILHKIFLENALNDIDTKYKEQLQLTEEKIFTYSNIFNMPLYYNPISLKKTPDYNLYNKLQNNNVYETIYFIIGKIQDNNYNAELVLLLYSYIANIYLNKTLDNYTENFYNNKKMKHQKMKMFQNSKIVSSIQSHIFSV